MQVGTFSPSRTVASVSALQQLVILTPSMGNPRTVLGMEKAEVGQTECTPLKNLQQRQKQVCRCCYQNRIRGCRIFNPSVQTFNRVKFNRKGIINQIRSRSLYSLNSELTDLGCWRDTGDRAIPLLEDQGHAELDGFYKDRADAVEKCEALAVSEGNIDEYGIPK